MVKVVYDYQAFDQKYGGVSRYIYELAVRLSNSADLSVNILALAHENEYLKNCTENIVIGFPFSTPPKTEKIRSKFNSEVSRFFFNMNPPEIVHETYYYPKKLSPKKTKIVITIHDMIHEKFSQYLHPKDKASLFKKEAAKRADHIICVSNNTKKDLIEILDIPSQKISTIYHGYSLKFDIDNQLSVKKDSPYILYVGARRKYKNFHRLIQAYGTSSQLRNDFKLVCFGGGSLSTEELSLINELGLPEGKVLNVSGNDATLVNFYRGASVFVYPSLYEGFGIPLLESMSLQCPVACSNTSSMPEVAGNAAEFFDPYEIESITYALERVLYSSERAENLVKLGTERIKHFSWQACAEQTRQVYLSLV
jgi:glycosyltransferase involved in cell wall biosynthesis